MDRIKTEKLVITFPTTTSAMAMEEACSPEDGRLIPIPREISGGCGLAWCAVPQAEERLLGIMEENHISFEKTHIIALY